jgi:hypothetical protein
MGQLEQGKYIVSLCTRSHVLPKYPQQRLHLQILDDLEIVQDLTARHFHSESIETLKHVGEATLREILLDLQCLGGLCEGALEEAGLESQEGLLQLEGTLAEDYPHVTPIVLGEERLQFLTRVGKADPHPVFAHQFINTPIQPPTNTKLTHKTSFLTVPSLMLPLMDYWWHT